jgi:hypothetical protein
MSALEQMPLDFGDRRRAERLHVSGTQEVLFGRGAGVLVDLSRRGARIRHTAPVRRGASVRVSFTWAGARFSSDAEVLASRMVSLGSAMSYESRVLFPFIDHPSEKVLKSALEDITERDLRRSVANMLGWNDDSQRESAPLTTSFIRCRLRGRWWEKKVTNDRTQPEDGFVLRAESIESDIQTLCSDYSGGGEADRQMIRLMASAAVADDTDSRSKASLVRATSPH